MAAAMKPGRELDALIAEKVMGWTSVGRAKNADHDFYGITTKKDLECVYRVPKFSTDFTAAWEVLKKVKSFDGRRSGVFLDELFPRSSRDLWNLSPSAVCFAALKAIGE